MMRNKLTAMMVDDCLHDPILAAKIILGIKEFPPNQVMRLWGMWTKPFFMDSSGFGTGKTMNIAIMIALRSVLFHERISGVIGRNFNQGKLIFNYLDKWARKSNVFASQIAHSRGEVLAISHNESAWTMTFKNESVVRVIPPDFARDAERVASESWSDGYFDEWTRYGNYEAFLKIIVGRVRKPIDIEIYDPKDPVNMNHMCLFGTARSTSSRAYTIVKNWQKEIDNKNKNYDHQSWNFEDYPEKYKYLLNMDLIKMMVRNNTRQTNRMEILGEWIDEAGGLYSTSAMDNARRKIQINMGA